MVCLDLKGCFPFPAGSPSSSRRLVSSASGFGQEVQESPGRRWRFGGASGDGGTVDVDNNKNITTHGSNSNGIFAQSVGGGGGVGGKAAIGLTGLLGLGGEGTVAVTANSSR